MREIPIERCSYMDETYVSRNEYEQEISRMPQNHPWRKKKRIVNSPRHPVDVMALVDKMWKQIKEERKANEE